MRRAVRANPAKTPPTKTIQEPAPTKGWMSQENFAEADPQSAVILKNMFPEADAVRARRGHVSFATGMSGTIETILPYVGASLGKLFAAVGGFVFDITPGGAVGAAELSGLTNAYWQNVMFATSAGQFLVMVNGADGVRTYNGAAWADQTASITGAGSVPATFIDVTAHKKRLWFVPNNSTDLYYLPTESIAGGAAKFPVGAQLKRGGAIMSIGTYSVDAGDGMDDLFVVVSTEGEVVIYGGTDPASSLTWELIGVYVIGKPVGRRCLFQVGGDLLVINEDGILPISAAIKVHRAVAGEKAITKNIRQAYVDAVQRARTVQGWQIVAHPIRNMALLNVPGSGSISTEQFAFNTITGAWGQFTNMPAACWAAFENNIYFGGDGEVFKAEFGANDNGQPIQVEVLPAFSHVGARGRLKHVKMLKPYFSTDIPGVAPMMAVAIDYKVPGAPAAVSNVDGNFFQWDVTPWDGPAVWYDEEVITDWSGASNLGTVIAPYMRLDVDAAGAGAEFEFRWIATDIVYELGGVI